MEGRNKMNAVAEYLYEKAQQPEKEWLRREPCVTIPLIREAVRSARDKGLFYDDDVQRYVAEIFGIEASGPLFKQLGHECYLGKGELKDEALRVALQEARAAGYVAQQLSKLPDGRYLMRFGTTYVGQSVPTYSEPFEYRVKNGALYKKHAKQGQCVTGWALCRPI
jgi:hypothetical protein